MTDLERTRAAVIKAALYVVYSDWNNSWDTYDDVATNDMANDILDDALAKHVNAVIASR